MGINCKIRYNKNKEVDYVEDKQGNRSELFDELRTLFGVEKALDLYALTESEDFQNENEIKYSILGEKGAFALDQTEEATFRIDNLFVAKEMEQTGKTPKEIKIATGWEKGGDGLWRYEEIDNILSKDTPNVRNKILRLATKNEQYLSDLELLPKGYNEILKDLKISFVNVENNVAGQYDPNTNTIEFPKSVQKQLYSIYEDLNIGNYWNSLTREQNKNLERFNKTLLHESQHAIQIAEGFAEGGDINIAINAELSRITGLIKKDESFLNDDEKFTKLLSRLKSSKSFEDLKRELKSNINELYDYKTQLIKKEITYEQKVALYKQLAGEVESRNVESRMGLSLEERRNKLLQETEDIAREDQMFIKSNLKSLSISQPQYAEREVINRLKQNGLANNVFEMNIQEINAKLEELGVDAETRKQIGRTLESRGGVKGSVFESSKKPEKIVKFFNKNTIYNTLVNSDAMDTLKAIENHTGLAIHSFSPTSSELYDYQELLSNMVDNNKIEFNLIEEDTGVTKADINKLLEIIAKRLTNVEDTRTSYFQFQKYLDSLGINLITNGFVYKNDVYLNKDIATNETAIHEFSHLYNSWLKQSRPELYNRGLELVKAELKNKNSEIKDIINYVKTTQPSLKGEVLKEEILTEVIGRRGVELLESQKAKKGGVIEWLKDAWREIGNMLGLSQMTVRQVVNLNLEQYVKAVGVDLLSGENLKIKDIVEYTQRTTEELSTENKIEALDSGFSNQDEMFFTLKKAFINDNGLVVFDRTKMKKAGYNEYEIISVLTRPELQNSIRENIFKVQNTPFSLDLEQENLVKTDEITAFGKQKTIIKTEQEGTNEIVNGEIVPKKSDTLQTLKRTYPLESTPISNKLSKMFTAINTLTENVAQRNVEELKTVAKGIQKKVVKYGVDLRGIENKVLPLKRFKEFMLALESYIINPNDSFSDVYDNLFEIADNEPKNQNENEVKLDTELSEYELFRDFNLIRKQGDIYTRIAPESLEDLYNYFFRQQNEIKTKEEVQIKTAELEVTDEDIDGDILEAMYMWKKFLNYPVKTISNFKPNSVDLKEAVENPYLKASSRGVVITSNDPITRAKKEIYDKEKITKEERTLILEGLYKPAKIKTEYSIIEDGVLVTKNNPEQFISTNTAVYEKAFQEGNISFYEEVIEKDKTFPEIQFSKYINELSVVPDSYIEKETLSKEELEKINKNNFDCI